MKRLTTYLLALSAGLLLLTACKKQTEYLVDGGGAHNPQVNVTTYDYLKSNPLFDTLVLLIDRTGLKDVINANNTTFFAPTDYTITHWLNATRGRIIVTYGQDSARKFGLNVVNYTQVKDSLSQYIIKERVQRENLALTDKEFNTALPGDKKIVYLREVDDYDGPYTSTKPRYLYITKVYGGRDLPGTTPPAAETDIEVLCQTSGILTTNGVLHVVNNQHLFGFNK